MSWRDLAATLMRRWYIALAGLMVTAGLVLLSPVIVPPQYTARGLIILLPPHADNPAGSNPFLDLGALDLPSRVLVAYYSSNSAMDAITAVSPDAEVTVSIEESTRSPVVAIDVTDSSPASTMKVLDYVAGTIPGTLTRLQTDVKAPTDTMVTSMPLTMDQRAEPDLSKLIRMLIAVVLGGLALTAWLIFAIDGALRRRREGRTGELAEPAQEEAEPPAEQPRRMDTDAGDSPSDAEQPAPQAPRRRRRRRSGAASADAEPLPMQAEDAGQDPTGPEPEPTDVDDSLQIRS